MTSPNSQFMHEHEITCLRSPTAIRHQCKQIFQLAEANELEYFKYDESQLSKVVSYVIEEINRNYPNLDIPYHGRLRHFEVGNIDRMKILKDRYGPINSKDFGKMLFELVVVSVLLDAGAGSQWKYYVVEGKNNVCYSRSEGLAIASFEMFISGAFSSDPLHPMKVNAKKLMSLSKAELVKGFQINERNPLVGIDGRLQILRNLGQLLLEKYPDQEDEDVCLGLVYENIYEKVTCEKKSLEIKEIFEFFVCEFNNIWPQGLRIGSTNLGDVGKHKKVQDHHGLGQGYVPFHKLTQWLTYSVIETFEKAGIRIVNIDELTGLPEYRNGGLFIDLELLKVKDKRNLKISHEPSSEFIVEWRALTLSILDVVADQVRSELSFNKEELPLAKILQGGTWSAGRRIASTLRENLSSPILIKSHGTIF